MVRDRDGQVRVLSRVCPHRGMDIMPPGFGYPGFEPLDLRRGIKGHGECSVLVCPYHNWTFGLDGRVKGCAEMQLAEGFVARRFVVPAPVPRADGDPAPAAADEDLGDISLRRGGSVSGRAVDEAGEPCGSAKIRLLAADGTTVGRTETDEDGVFVLAGVGDGVHSLDADGFGMSDPSVFGRAGPVRAGDADVRIVLSPGRAVRLHLVAAEDGKPLAVNAFTLFFRPAGSLENWTSMMTIGGAGSTICRAVAFAGVWDVGVSVPGRLPAAIRGVVVTDDAITDVDVVLREP